ncbi:ankyrin repeat-containing domain protein, partial [Ochromonadaceae sp. CCMP2298]
LWAAAQGGNTQDCESLIEIGADVNWRNHDGDTPLLAACRRGHTETIALLLAHGADSNTTGADWLAPLHICTKRGDAASVDALLNASTSTTLRTKEGQTALDIARAKGYESI